MRESFGNFVILNWEVLVSTIGYFFDDPGFIHFKDFDCLLPVVDSSHSPLIEFFLQSRLLLLDVSMRKLNGSLISEFVPDEAKDIL